jgi:hypothetical protein
MQQAALEYVVSSRADGEACSPEWVLVSLSGIGGWWPELQVAVRGSTSTNLGGSRTIQLLSELVVKFSH